MNEEKYMENYKMQHQNIDKFKPKIYYCVLKYIYNKKII